MSIALDALTSAGLDLLSTPLAVVALALVALRWTLPRLDGPRA